MAQNIFQGMPYDLKKLQLEVTDCIGSHIFFPYGKVYKPNDMTLMPKHYDTSVTFRGFFYRADTTTDALVEIHYSSKYYFKTYTAEDKVIWSANGSEDAKIDEEFPKLERHTQGFISLAVQIEGKKLRGICNFQKTPLRDMKEIKGWDWEYFVFSGSHIVSLHHYYEDKSQVSNKYWDMNVRKSPVVRVDYGGYAIYYLRYKGGNTDLDFDFDGNKGRMAIPISKDSEFTLYVRNAPTGYFVHASFQQAIVEVSRGSNRLLPDVEFSSNVEIIRAIFDGGMQTAQK